MKHRDDRDATIRELFDAAREADRAGAPGFRQTISREGRRDRPGPVGTGFRLVPTLALSTCLAVVAMASWWLWEAARHSAPVPPAARLAAAPVAPPPPPPRETPIRAEDVETQLFRRPSDADPAPESPARSTTVAARTPDPATEVAAERPEQPATVEEPATEMARVDALATIGYVNRLTPKPKPAPVSGAIDVHVTDQEGLPLPGATVTISHVTSAVATTAELTNQDGIVSFPVLRPTRGYSVQVAFPGFSPIRYDDLHVRLSQTVPLQIQMMEEFQENVKVVAESDVIDLDQVASSTRFSDEFMADLPVPSRFYRNALTVAPGVQDADGDGNPNVHGSRARDFKAETGGVSNAGSHEEMEVIAAGASVEFGRAQGGFGRIIRKQGHDESDLSLPGRYRTDFNTERYDRIEENDFRAVTDHPLSTFSIDVDTASYSNVRRFLRRGERPPADAVRIEELVNYFRYDYPQPTDGTPFAVHVETAACPWNEAHRLARIGLKGWETSRQEVPGSNLVFLIDVSGSMSSPNKLPLLKRALRLLVEQLDGRDQVAIVVYAGSSGLALPSTSGDRPRRILNALQRLESGGSTNGGAGLRLAYKVARENFIPGGVNRVILATDGDFNIGVTHGTELLSLIEKDAKRGIFLSVLGFGMGNYQDGRLELLSGKGNGNYAYIDDLAEARKVLVEELSGTLITIAKDVKIQVEFNPAEVGAYRLIGYENRVMPKEHFNDDRKDAGEIGAGHTVTALYEIVPAGARVDSPTVDPLRYQTRAEPTRAAGNGELLTVKLRYKEPEEDVSRLVTVPVPAETVPLAAASRDFKFAAAVAELGLLLRDSAHKGDADFEQVRTLALEGRGHDEHGRRAEFLELVDLAERSLSSE